MTRPSTPRNDIRKGTPDLARSLAWLGFVLGSGGVRRGAGYFERALAMTKALYPRSGIRRDTRTCPSLNNLGNCSRPRGPTARRGAISSERWR